MFIVKHTQQFKRLSWRKFRTQSTKTEFKCCTPKVKAINSFNYVGTVLTKGNEEEVEVEIQKKIMSANKRHFSYYTS